MTVGLVRRAAVTAASVYGVNEIAGAAAAHFFADAPVLRSSRRPRQERGSRRGGFICWRGPWRRRVRRCNDGAEHETHQLCVRMPFDRVSTDAGRLGWPRVDDAGRWRHLPHVMTHKTIRTPVLEIAYVETGPPIRPARHPAARVPRRHPRL